MSLISLAYVSIETRPMSKQDIMDILNTARTHNAELNITGMLLYRDGYFIQALEGDEQDVIALYEKIAEDKRHQNMLTVHREEIEERSFGDWQMGFRNLDELENPEDVQGYTDFLNADFSKEYFEDEPDRAHRLLRLFAEEANY